MAIGGRSRNRLGSDTPAGTRPVFDDDGLPEALRQPLTYQACNDVASSGGGEADDDAHRPRGVCLRACDKRDRRERGSARYEMQESAARKFHGAPQEPV